MINVFVKKSAEELQVQLSDRRMITQELKVGEWFRIDREVIDKSQEEIRCKCNEAGRAGKALWERFETANQIADENPDQYPRLIETYIFKHNWKNYKTEPEMRIMCEEVGEGMCDEVICDLELQMRICNGEEVYDLIKKADKLPQVRVIKLRNGGTGYFGGGVDDDSSYPPAGLIRSWFCPNLKYDFFTPYAFRRVLS